MELLDRLLTKLLQAKAKEIECVREEVEKPVKKLEQIKEELRTFRPGGKQA